MNNTITSIDNLIEKLQLASTHFHLQERAWAQTHYSHSMTALIALMEQTQHNQAVQQALLLISQQLLEAQEKSNFPYLCDLIDYELVAVLKQIKQLGIDFPVNS